MIDALPESARRKLQPRRLAPWQEAAVAAFLGTNRTKRERIEAAHAAQGTTPAMLDREEPRLVVSAPAPESEPAPEEPAPEEAGSP
jgi:hypothetical protein